MQIVYNTVRLTWPLNAYVAVFHWRDNNKCVATALYYGITCKNCTNPEIKQNTEANRSKATNFQILPGGTMRILSVRPKRVQQAMSWLGGTMCTAHTTFFGAQSLIFKVRFLQLLVYCNIDKHGVVWIVFSIDCWTMNMELASANCRTP